MLLEQPILGYSPDYDINLAGMSPKYGFNLETLVERRVAPAMFGVWQGGTTSNGKLLRGVATPPRSKRGNRPRGDARDGVPGRKNRDIPPPGQHMNRGWRSSKRLGEPCRPWLLKTYLPTGTY